MEARRGSGGAVCHTESPAGLPLEAMCPGVLASQEGRVPRKGVFMGTEKNKQGRCSREGWRGPPCPVLLSPGQQEGLKLCQFATWVTL